MKARILVLLILLLGAHSAWCDSRLAIVSDEASRACADLLTAELSKQHGIELVERDEIEKVMREHQLSINGNLEQELDISKLLRAQGILIMEVAQQNGASVIRARLVSVEQGVVIFDFDAPLASGKADGLAPLISNRVIPLLPKLQVARGKAVPISILNVRAIDADGASLEREVTAMLSSRLASEPAVFVLERRRLDLLSGEKNLGDETPGVFWNGAYLLDGNIESDRKTGNLTVHLRLRKPGEADGKTVMAMGTADAIKDLVEKLAGEVLAATGQPSTAADWKPEAEAAQYLDEAAWAWRQEEFKTCREAISSAGALGERSGDYVFLNTWLLCDKVAAPEEGMDQEKELRDPPTPLKERYAAALDALDGCYEYLAGHLDNHLQRFTTDDTGDARQAHLRMKVVSASSRTLEEVYGHPDPATPDAPLRDGIRKLQGFGVGPENLPRDYYAAEGTVMYAHLWANSADELASYYYTQLTSADQFQQAVANMIVPVLAAKQEQLFARFPDPAHAFAGLLAKLEATPGTRLAAYLIRSRGNAPVEERKAYYEKFLAEFWARRSELLHPKTLRGYIPALSMWSGDFHDVFYEERIRLLRYYLQNSSEGLDELMGMLWYPKAFPPAEAPAIWQEFNAFRQRCQADPKQLYSIQWDAREKMFLVQFPDLKMEAPPAPPQDAMEVTHFWTPYGIPDVPKENIMYFQGLWAEGKLWLLGGGKQSYLFAVDLKTFTAEYYQPPTGNRPYEELVAPNAIYVSSSNMLARYDRKAHAWATHKLTIQGENRLHLFDGRLYLDLWTWGGGDAMSGALARYDWDSDQLAYLADSRRRPALNQFDDRNGYHVDGLFPGPGHKLCALIEGHVYYAREDAGNWDSIPLKAPTQRDYFHMASFEDKALLFSPDCKVFYYIDPDKKVPERWVGEGGPSLWDVPATLDVQFGSMGLTPGGFYVLAQTREASPKAVLHWYQRGGPRAGITIPLEFKMDDATADLLTSVVGARTNQPREKIVQLRTTVGGPMIYRVVDTGEGIAILTYSGVWFISFQDIEAHLKTAGTKTALVN